MHQNACTVREKKGKVESSSFNLKNGSVQFRKTYLKDPGNYICLNLTKINGVYNLQQNRLQWGRSSERPAARTQQELTEVTPSGGSGVSNDDTNSLSPTWTLKLTESWGGYKENDSKGEVESEIGVACAAIP